MSKSNILFFMTVCLMTISCQGQNENKIPDAYPELKISGKKISEIVSFFPDNQPGGTFLVTQNGQHIASGAQGKANLENDINMKMNNIFNIASVTKTFTAVAVFKMIEQGKISLNDRISEYIVGFPEKGKDITIGHLLSHSSGMGYSNDHQEQYILKRNIKTKKDHAIAEYFKDEKFTSAPGIKYDYNNSAYMILGYIIEKVNNKTYEEYLEETFFKSLNMNNTKLDNLLEEIEGKAIGYDCLDGENYKIRNVSSKDSEFYSAGGLTSTVEDLSIWFEALMDYKIINESNLKKLTTPIRYKDDTYASNGYGVFTGSLNGKDYILHDGLDWGYGSIILYFPETKLLIVHLRNCGYCKYDIGMSYGTPIKLASTLLDCEYDLDYNINTKLIGAFKGSYQSPLSQEKKVIIEDGKKLYIESRFGMLPLMRISEYVYFVEKNNETITFKKLKNNKMELISNKGIPIIFKK